MNTFGFQISLDDIKICFEDLYNSEINDEFALKIIEVIDVGYCADQALKGNDLDMQTEYAYEAIKEEIQKKRNFGEI